jgi:hypothetical protein
MAAEDHISDRRQKKSGTEGFRINDFRTQHLVKSGDLIREFDQPLPQTVPGCR